MYAGFWKRLVAHILDSIIVSMVLLIPISMLSSIIILVSFGDSSAEPGDVAASLLAITAICFSAIIPMWLYYALMEASKYQGTLGKILLGLKVTDLEGNKVTFGKATGRFFGKILSGFMNIGYIMVAATEKKQGLHDMLAKTLVIDKTKENY